jgi:hypothetical protein
MSEHHTHSVFLLRMETHLLGLARKLVGHAGLVCRGGRLIMMTDRDTGTGSGTASRSRAATRAAALVGGGRAAAGHRTLGTCLAPLDLGLGVVHGTLGRALTHSAAGVCSAGADAGGVRAVPAACGLGLAVKDVRLWGKGMMSFKGEL